MGYCTAAIHEHTHLACDFEADLGQLARQLLADHPIHRDPTSGKPLQPFDLAGFEAAGVAENVDWAPLLWAVGPGSI